MSENAPVNEAKPAPVVGESAVPGAPVTPPPRRSPGHRGQDVRDTVAEMAAKAHEISLEAGSKMAAAMKDVIGAAAGLTGFAIESARDLVQYMVRRGQMTQDEADKLIREAEDANAKRKPAATKSPAAPPSRAAAPAKPAAPKVEAPAKAAPPAAKKSVPKAPAAKAPAAKTPAARTPAAKSSKTAKAPAKAAVKRPSNVKASVKASVKPAPKAAAKPAAKKQKKR
jgi:polyhydroxyalkanoate synthesis regulator phasin